MHRVGAKPLQIWDRLWLFPIATLVVLLFIDFSSLAQSPPSGGPDAQASSSPAPGQGQVNPPSRPPYQLDRSEEDWSFLRDPSLRTDRWDSVKYIPLGRQDWYLSLGGEFRPFYEAYRNYNWGLGPQDGDGYFLHRFIGHADFRLGRRARVFFELKSGVELGRNGGPRPSQDEDKLDLSQLFLDLHPRLRNGVPALTLRIGRQELNYGEGGLVSIRELNVRREFDGVKLILRPAGWRVDAFAVKPA
ncbi:MAG: alginate export family protein [Pyrinomonadaceae bacterium]